MDASVHRVQPEPVVAGRRDAARPQKRKKRENDGQEGEPPFTLEPRAKDAHATHPEPRSPSEEGLGRNLDVTA